MSLSPTTQKHYPTLYPDVIFCIIRFLTVQEIASKTQLVSRLWNAVGLKLPHRETIISGITSTDLIRALRDNWDYTIRDIVTLKSHSLLNRHVVGIKIKKNIYVVYPNQLTIITTQNQLNWIKTLLPKLKHLGLTISIQTPVKWESRFPLYLTTLDLQLDTGQQILKHRDNPYSRDNPSNPYSRDNNEYIMDRKINHTHIELIITTISQIVSLTTLKITIVSIKRDNTIDYDRKNLPQTIFDPIANLFNLTQFTWDWNCYTIIRPIIFDKYITVIGNLANLRYYDIGDILPEQRNYLKTHNPNLMQTTTTKKI